MNQNISKEQSNYLTYMVNGTTLQTASGTISYGMTNDYMFRAVLQSNNKVLRGLICALLHLSEKEVISVEIVNPVILGEAIESKEFRLDINVLLNNRTLINLEMQIANKLNWQDRSVIYLCRAFDNLTHGQDYSEAGTVIHIGFLDYTLFADCPEFYASYKLINVKSYQTYSDKITLNVVDLSRIDLATEEDKQYHIDYWAALFKATTWEEIRMLASKDDYLNEASETIFRLSADEQIRKQCRDREEYYQDMRNYERALSDCEKALAEQENLIAENTKVIKEKDVEIQALRNEIEQLKKQRQQ
ncbi:MAG: PD-(D/E)XK nuclease family transposase [Lachnospiraceae bacterium]|nr:PD-(D/E)XK nuclease family transposase [Lachnospiraceae bacterium]